MALNIEARQKYQGWLRCRLLSFFWLTSPMYGLTTAAVVRISHHLGAEDVKKARGVAKLCACLACSLALLIAVTLVLLRDELGYVFSQDEPVVRMVAALVPLVAGAYTFVGVAVSVPPGAARARPRSL